MRILPENWQQNAEKNKQLHKKMLLRIDKKKVIPALADLHEDAFSKLSCLDCAACCRNYSPRFKPPDIRRISKYVGMKESQFIDEYLVRDEEGDYVVTSKPCPFLAEDNTCNIYEVRPSDCARFPYTDEDVLLNKPAITLKNSTFCPAVYLVLENIKTRFHV